jgi:hypothetical protein
VENMQVRYFAGNCISADTSLNPTAYPGSLPNANNSVIRRNSLYFCKGSGAYFHGANANQITVQNNDATDNNGAGFYEASFLGNLYLGNHASFNAQGATVSPGNTINFSTFVGEYSEGGQPTSVFDQYQLVLNGDHGAGLQPGPQGQILQLGGWTRHNTIELLQGPKLFGLHAGSGPSMQPGTLFGFGAAEDTANTCCGGTSAALRNLAYQFGYDQLQPGWYSLYYGGNYAAHQANSVLAFSGSTAVEGAGHLWLLGGYYLGAPGGRAHVSSAGDGILLLRNNALDGFGRVQFGGTTARFPALKRTGTRLDARLADDSDVAILTGTLVSPLKSDAFSSAININFAQGNVHTVTLRGNVTGLTFSNLIAGGEYILRLVQDATGGRSVAWTNVRWAGGQAPRLSTGANRVDIFRFISPDGATLEEVGRALDVR